MTERTYTAEFRSGFRATLVLSLTGMRCEWVPERPDVSQRRGRQLIAAYRIWRDECIEDVARANGLTVQNLGHPDVIGLCELKGVA